MNNVINLNMEELTKVQTYTITTKDGKPLTLKGELAKNVSALDGLGKMTDKASLYKAIFITRIMHMESDDFKKSYSVKDGETFITKYLGYSKKTIGLYKDTIDMFFTSDGDVKNPVLENYNLAQLQELTKYIRNDMEKYDYILEEALDDLYSVCSAEFPFTMSSKNMRKAIDEYFTTVEEPTGSNEESTGSNEESTGSNEESTGSNEESTGSNEESSKTVPLTLDMMLAKAKTVLVRCSNAREMFDAYGHYTGDEIENHFRDTLDFVIGLLTIENK
jgi:hypothetical protein